MPKDSQDVSKYTRRPLYPTSYSKQPTKKPFSVLHIHHLIEIPHTNRPMHRLDIDLITLPCLIPQQVEISDKVPASVTHLTELGRVLYERVADRNAAMACREGQQTLKGTREC